MLLITYRTSNTARGPNRAITSKETFLLFNPSHIVLDQSLYLLAFPLYTNVDSGRCWFFVDQNWRILPQNGNLLVRIPETNHSFLENWQDSCLSSEYLITPFPVLSAHLLICLSCWVAQFQSSTSFYLVSLRHLVGLRPPSNFLIHFLSLSLSLPILSKTQVKKAFLSSCGWFLTLTLTTSIGIWHGAGATKGVTSHAAHRGYMAWCRCHEILIALAYYQQVFCLDPKKSQLNRNILSGGEEKRSKMTVRHEL